MSVVVDPLNDPELAAAGAALRAEWRTDEEEWSRAAFEHWQHDQSLLDVARDCMHRGDTLVVLSRRNTFRGVVSSVGEDVMRVATAEGPVVVHVNADAPLALRVVMRATAGGARGDREPASLRAVLLDLETSGARVEVGVAIADAVLTGMLRVGRDQVAVRDGDGFETYVPLRWVTWVRSSVG
jgi:hypothetical protein